MTRGRMRKIVIWVWRQESKLDKWLTILAIFALEGYDLFGSEAGEPSTESDEELRNEVEVSQIQRSNAENLEIVEEDPRVS